MVFEPQTASREREGWRVLKRADVDGVRLQAQVTGAVGG